MKRILIIGSSVVVVLVIVAFIGMIAAGILPVGLGMHDQISQTDGVALGGYDPISYFENSPAMGLSEFAAEHEGITWHFASAEHLAQFESNPTKFTPAYGGHCSLAMSTGFAVEGEPESYEIIDDKLYIFSGDEVKATFMEDADASIKACDANWNE